MISNDGNSCHGPRRARASATSHSLTTEDARLVKGMLLRGDAQHRIAAWFDQNPARIADIASGARHAEVLPAPVHELPPDRRSLRPCDAAAALGALAAAEQALATARQLIGQQ